MRTVEFHGAGWRSGAVLVAETFWERLRGLIARPPDTAMLVPGRSVHGFGMRRSCQVVALDGDGVVVSSSILRPGTLVRVPAARWMLELPTTAPLPPVGGVLAGRSPIAGGRSAAETRDPRPALHVPQALSSRSCREP
ncbi:MAG TPA: hypothetical protein VIY70_10215 [Acidimicrobiia bacterium]